MDGRQGDIQKTNGSRWSKVPQWAYTWIRQYLTVNLVIAFFAEVYDFGLLGRLDSFTGMNMAECYREEASRS